MRLNGRDLRSGNGGDDVRLLHRELAGIGLEIADPEAKEGVFGKNTLRAIRRFQDASGLPVTGIVDEATAKAINARFDESHADKPDHPDDTSAKDDGQAHDDAHD